MFLKSYNYKRARKTGAAFNFTSYAINIVSEETHSEAVFEIAYKQISFSNTMADGVKGCRFKYITYSHPERWDTDIIPVSKENIIKRIRKACKLADVTPEQLYIWAKTARPGDILHGPNHKKYDFLGTALSFVSRAKVVKSSKKKGRCCEDVMNVILSTEPELAKIVNPEEITPDDARLIVRVWRYGISRTILVYESAETHKPLI